MLRSLMKEVKSGDVLVVAAIDRLGRRAAEVLTLVDDLRERGISIVSVREGIDFSTSVGKFVLAMLASVAEMERNFIVERTQAGLAAARAKGRVGGRPRSISDRTIERGVRLVKDQGYTIKRAGACEPVRQHTLADGRKAGPGDAMAISFTDIQQTVGKLAFSDPQALREAGGFEKLMMIYEVYPVQIAGQKVCILIKRGLSPRKAKALTEREAAVNVLVLEKIEGRWNRAWPITEMAPMAKAG
jgi:hypothetical protein